MQHFSNVYDHNIFYLFIFLVEHILTLQFNEINLGDILPEPSLQVFVRTSFLLPSLPLTFLPPASLIFYFPKQSFSLILKFTCISFKNNLLMLSFPNFPVLSIYGLLRMKDKSLVLFHPFNLPYTNISLLSTSQTFH